MAPNPLDLTHRAYSAPRFTRPNPLLAASRWSHLTKEVYVHGMMLSIVEHTFSQHEDEIVDLIRKHNVKRAFFTGHSLGGGIANIAHLVVRGQLAKAGSPWAQVANVSWVACTFAAPQTIVRKYKPANAPDLMSQEVDPSSYNIVYGCDVVPRAPGMLNFLGATLVEVLPKLAEEKADAFVESFPLIGWLHSFAGPVVSVASTFSPVQISDGVKLLKKNGVAEAIGQFSHFGTIVYMEASGMRPPDGSFNDGDYLYLKDGDIPVWLDIGLCKAPTWSGEDSTFTEHQLTNRHQFLWLWGEDKHRNPDKNYIDSALYAHRASYSRFMYGRK